MKILITGDLVVKEEYDGNKKIDPSIKELFHKSDLNIINLEAPVTQSISKISKTGPNIKSEKNSALNVLKILKVDLVTLANNHILDYGESGVKDTLHFCEEYNIGTVGAGMNLEDAAKTFFVNSDEGKIAIVNFAENEWTSATKTRAGSNPICLEDNYKQIIEAKQNADFVITIVHGGHEHYQYPSPATQKRYRFYAEIGSDAVIAHHTHCIGGVEMYKETPICYSLGNFLFPKDKQMKESWYTGLIASLEIKKEKPVQVKLLPVELNKNTNQLNLLQGNKKESIEKKLEAINDIILNPEKLEQEFESFVKRVEPGFIKRLTPIGAFTNRYVNGGLYKSKVYKWFLNNIYVKESLNRIRCEAHHEVLMKMYSNMFDDFKENEAN